MRTHPGEKTFNEIKNDFEKEDGWLIKLCITKYKFLIREYLPGPNTKFTIGYKSNNFEWGEFVVEDYSQSPEDNAWDLKVRLKTKGQLTIYVGREEFSYDISLDLRISVVGVYYEEYSNFNYTFNSIEVKDEDLKCIEDYDSLILNEYQSHADFQDLDYDLLTKVWPHLENGNKNQVYITSFDYFNELENIYRQIKYTLAQARVYSRYSQKFVDERTGTSRTHYGLAITSHHRRYLDYCTFSIQSLYTYWERLAMLMYQFIKPGKLKPLNLSFKSLISTVQKDKLAGKLDIDVDWFLKLIDTDHLKLQVLRHPLIHFQIDREPMAGSFLGDIHSTWIKNISNKQALLEMETRNNGLIVEIFNMTKKCKEGYDRSIRLIIDHSEKSLLLNEPSKP